MNTENENKNVENTTNETNEVKSENTATASTEAASKEEKKEEQKPAEEVTYSKDENGDPIIITLVHTVDENGNPKIIKKIKKIKKVSKKGEKLSTPLSFLLTIGLLAFTFMSYKLLMNVVVLSNAPKGVLDLEEVNRAKPLNPIEILNQVDSDARKTVVNYLLKDNPAYKGIDSTVGLEAPKEEVKEETAEEQTDTTTDASKVKEKEKSDFMLYLEGLSNNEKLLLGGIENITDYNAIQDNLKAKFNSTLKVEPKSLVVQDGSEAKEVYIYNISTKSYYFNYIYKDLFLKKFEFDGEMIIYEADVERIDQMTLKITTYSLFLIKKDGKSYINNKDKTLVPQDVNMSIDDLKEKLENDYADKKEQYDQVTYLIKQVDGKCFVSDVKIK